MLFGASVLAVAAVLGLLDESPGIAAACRSASAQRMDPAMLATLCSYAGTSCIGMNCDAEVFVEPKLLSAVMREGLDEVLALGDGSPSPSDAAAAEVSE